MTALLLTLFCLLYPTDAWAYVDPGSITLLVQVIVAFALGSIIAFKNRIIDVVKRIFGGNKPPAGETANDDKK